MTKWNIHVPPRENRTDEEMKDREEAFAAVEKALEENAKAVKAVYAAMGDFHSLEGKYYRRMQSEKESAA
jgi:hypothetical protein